MLKAALAIGAGALLALAPAVATAARRISVSERELTQLRIEARTARDVQEVQNLMSRRAMYHSIGHNEQELELWSKHQEIRWAQNAGCWIGDDFRNYYVTTNYAMQKAALEQISKANPAIANDYARNRYIGSNVFHILTTPIIEIAGDGQTAKGFWYTPGAILSTSDGRTGEGVNMWERYGGDFVREGGQWRILHLEVMTDFAYPFGGTLATPVPGMPDASKSGSESAGGAPGPGAEGVVIPGPTIRMQLAETYSATRVPKLSPRLPEPYRTLGETFQYANCHAANAADRSSGNPDVTPFVRAVDADHDGRMTHAEWTASGAPESAYRMLSAAHPGYVTKSDMEATAPPPGIDLDGDGKVTLEEFKRFNLQHASRAASPQP